MTEAKLWTRNFITVSTINFFLVLVFYLLVVVVGLYATSHLQASVSEAGLVVGLFVVGVLLGRLLIGQYLDRIGRKRCMLIGLFLATTASLLYYIHAGIGFLIAVRFVHGIGVGFAATAIATLIAHLVPPSRKGEGIGYFSMSTSIATAIGPFIGIYMNQHTDFSVILTLCCVLSAVTFFVALLLDTPEATQEEQEHSSQLNFSLRRLVEPRVLPFCSIILIFAVCFGGILSYINAYAKEVNLSEAASFFFIAYSITVLISRPFSGRLLDVRGANVVMYPCFALFALGLYLLGTAENGPMLLIAGSLIGLGFGNIQSCMQAIVISLVEPKSMGLATSTYFICVDTGLGFGPYLLGFLIPYTGYGTFYVLLAGVVLIGSAVYFGLYGYKSARLPRHS